MGQIAPGGPTRPPIEALRAAEAKANTPSLAATLSVNEVLDALRRCILSGALDSAGLARVLTTAIKSVDGVEPPGDDDEARIRAEFEAERRRMLGEPPLRRRRPRDPLA